MATILKLHKWVVLGGLGASCSFGSKRTVTTELHDMIKTVSASVPQPSTNTAKSSYGAYYTYLRKADVPSLSSDIGYVFMHFMALMRRASHLAGATLVLHSVGTLPSYTPGITACVFYLPESW